MPVNSPKETASVRSCTVCIFAGYHEMCSEAACTASGGSSMVISLEGTKIAVSSEQHNGTRHEVKFYQQSHFAG